MGENIELEKWGLEDARTAPACGGSAYKYPHCGWNIELRACMEDEWHQRMHQLTVHAFELSFPAISIEALKVGKGLRAVVPFEGVET